MTLRHGFALVEDINDPEQLGRVRARIIHMDGEKKDIPTDKLPWTTILSPATGIGMQGAAGSGTSPVGIRPGATLYVMYDDENPELRTAMGTVPVRQKGK